MCTAYIKAIRTFWQVQCKIEHGMLSNRSLVKLAVGSSVLGTATPIVAYITRTPFQFLRSHHSIIMAHRSKTLYCTSLQEIQSNMEFFLHTTTTDVNLGYTPLTIFLTHQSHRIATVDHICTRSCGSRREASQETLETAVGLYVRIARCLQSRSKIQDTILRLTATDLTTTPTDLTTTQEQLAKTEEHLRALCLVHIKWQDSIKEIQSHNQTIPMREGGFGLSLVDHIFAKITELADGLFQNGE
jgi:hypothetical protein